MECSSSWNWKEVLVCGERGRRQIHYYLNSPDEGSQILAVVGKDKSSSGHMSYHPHISPPPTTTLTSRSQLIQYLNSLLSDPPTINKSSAMDKHASKSGRDTTTVFQWLGSPSSCRKKRSHYPSFQRNGVTISVHDFVYVLAEDNKRLVAYLEDMYEDPKGTKMVVVRWYHTTDEVGLVLTQDYSHREVFFSLSLQHLSIECIDGLAAVLSPQHFHRFLKLPKKHTQLEPFVCRRHFENDQVFPFDITRVKGYWKQDILRYIKPRSSSEVNRHGFRQSCIDPETAEENTEGAEIMPPRKRQCRERREEVDFDFKKGGIGTQGTREVRPGSHMADKIFKDKSSQYYEVGSCVEVLSQDSGIRGCWFRASVIKKHKDKVKVRYEDIRDADDEANNLEEWISASRVASPDPLGLRSSGRLVVRPSHKPEIKGRVVRRAVDVGTVVDVWRHDAWWEGIVVESQSDDDKFRVFFPGEKLDSIICREELRRSREWIGNVWTLMKERRDLVASILSSLETKQVTKCESEVLRKDERGLKDSEADLAKDDVLSQLKWKSSKKRRRCSRSPVQKEIPVDTKDASKGNFLFSRTRETFMISPSLKHDSENCKYGRNSLFSCSSINKFGYV